VNTAARRVEHLRELGRLDDAEREARTALAAEPENAVLLTALAAVLLNAGRHDEGLAAAEAATAADPQDERAHRLRALQLSRLGRHHEAVEAGYRSVSLAPEEPLAATGYARVLQRAGRLPDAAEVAHRVVALGPDVADSHFLLADITSDLGDRQTARQAYAETLRLDPQHAAARHDLAVLDARAHRPAQALKGLVDAGTMDPGMPQVLHTVAAVLWQLSWRLRIWLAVATLVALVTASAGPGASRIVAGAILLISAALVWWTVRDLPPRTRPVVQAALRTDGPLRFTAAVTAGCLLVYVAIVATGLGLLAGLVWLALALLGWLALGVRAVRGARRRREARGGPLR
jgi:tetratricopeptide (TPR) repeat protein